MMNLLKLFFAVVTAHFAVVGVLFFLPGCQTLEEGKSSPSQDTSSYPEDEDEATYASINDEVDGSSGLRRPPTRPTWSLSNTHAQSVPGDTSNPDVLEPLSPNYDLPPVSESSSFPYIVQKGDTLWGLSHRYNVPVSAIASSSGISAKAPLKVGQKLTIPAASLKASSSSFSDKGGATYTVRKGDTLSGIAARNGTTVAALKQANGLQYSTIRVGQTLTLSGEASLAPKKQEPAPGLPSSTQIKGDTYTVARGDTLSGIAKRTGVSVNDLMAINGVDNPSQLQVGQVLALKGDVRSSAPVYQPAVEAPSDDVFDSAEDVPVVETVVVDEEEEEFSDDFGDDSVFDSVDEVSVIPVDGTNS